MRRKRWWWVLDAGKFIGFIFFKCLFQAMNQRVIEECAAIAGLNRHLLLLWSRDFAMRPDRAFVGGYGFRFVDRRQPGEP